MPCARAFCVPSLLARLLLRSDAPAPSAPALSCSGILWPRTAMIASGAQEVALPLCRFQLRRSPLRRFPFETLLALAPAQTLLALTLSLAPLGFNALLAHKKCRPRRQGPADAWTLLWSAVDDVGERQTSCKEDNIGGGTTGIYLPEAFPTQYGRAKQPRSSNRAHQKERVIITAQVVIITWVVGP